jgi:hypothetical protein
MKPKIRHIRFSKSASVDPNEQRDINSAKGNVQRSINVGRKAYDLYPWGENNLLPNERIKLLRTNGDAQNLIEARADFLFGGGFGWFKHINKNGIITREPYTDHATEEYSDAYGMEDLGDVANHMCTSLIETANIFVNRTLTEQLPIYSIKDTLICRSTVRLTKGAGTWLLNSDWSNYESVTKNTLAVPGYNPENAAQKETIFQLRPYQTGQAYYGFAQYWGEETVFWIEVMNFIAKSIGQTVKHNKNIAHICRVASQYFDQMIASASIDDTDDSYDPEKEKEKVRSEFYKNVEKMIESEDGPRVIFDECDMGPDGKLSGMIAFEEIKRSLNAKELQEAYDTALRAFANASRLLPTLAGVSDGKTIGGSGSELKVSANYQQFFRTPRERQLILHPFNRDVKKVLKLPKDVYAGFFDILLVSDDKNAAGKEAKTTKDSGKKDPNATQTENEDAA